MLTEIQMPVKKWRKIRKMAHKKKPVKGQYKCYEPTDEDWKAYAESIAKIRPDLKRRDA